MKFKHVHKWLSLIVFIQLLIWLASGFLLGKVDAAKATSRETFVRANTDTVAPIVSITTLLKDYPSSTQISLISLVDKPVYKIQFSSGAHSYQASEYKLVDALNGETIHLDQASKGSKQGLNEHIIHQIALQSHKQYSALLEIPALTKADQQTAEKLVQQAIISSTYMQPPIDDLPRERNAVWQVKINDEMRTSVYIRAQTGEVVAHVNDETRWRDLLLMLHFMDYQQEGTFNNIFSKIFALLTLLLSGTGLWWLICLLRDGQIKLSWFIRKKAVLVLAHNVDLSSSLPSSTGSSLIITASANHSILTSLSNHNIDIPATCGGGGVCGTCVIKSASTLRVSPVDAKHLSAQQLEEGYRMACQHLLKEVSSIELVPRGA